MPEAKAWGDLFTATRAWCTGKEDPPITVKGPCIGKALEAKRLPNGAPDLLGEMQIGHYCSVRRINRDWYSLHIEPSYEALEAVMDHTIVVEHDRMSWEIVEWQDGRALVLCHHSTILGSVWLAIIDAKTIPKEEPDAEEDR